jgi:hypothetical protein
MSDAEPSVLDEWPEALRLAAFKAAINMELLDGYRRILDAETDRMFANLRGNPPRGILAALSKPKPAPPPDQVGFLVTGDRCDRCGDTNHTDDGVCLTCTYPDDPCSRAYLDTLGPDDTHGGRRMTSHEPPDEPNTPLPRWDFDAVPPYDEDAKAHYWAMWTMSAVSADEIRATRAGEPIGVGPVVRVYPIHCAYCLRWVGDDMEGKPCEGGEALP